MDLLKKIKLFINIRYLKAIDRRNKKSVIDKVIEKYNLKDPTEQKKLMEQYQMSCSGKRAFGRKTRLHIEEKIQFMLVNNLI